MKERARVPGLTVRMERRKARDKRQHAGSEVEVCCMTIGASSCWEAASVIDMALKAYGNGSCWSSDSNFGGDYEEFEKIVWNSADNSHIDGISANWASSF